MSTLLHLASFCFLGFSAVNAYPQTPGPSTNLPIYYKGQHFDNGTGIPFDLYVDDDSLDNPTAFSKYWSGCNETSIDKRDWYDCQYGFFSGLQAAGCSVGHGLGGFVAANSAQTTNDSVVSLLTESFVNGRGYHDPRSTCLSRNNQNICVSWASYEGGNINWDEQVDVASYAVGCAQGGGSSEFKATMSDGGTLYICVSNRATGCGNSVC